MIPEDDIIKDRLKAKSRMIQQNRIQIKDNEIRVSFFGDEFASIFINWIGTKQQAEQLRSQILQDAKIVNEIRKKHEELKCHDHVMGTAEVCVECVEDELLQQLVEKTK